ncbi:alkaline phosphatase family protein [Alteromonas lipolytica]|uniref:Phosphodiesterase n=1 Tax=Alteromonas lipolytica TaxID=1856405 RepID=A0A1E8FCT8_9ALTE|nr:ectonucleotide pyrophosphatase/phosphodiesterase [Alteromonas lipolytica]OFI33719.1 phosphodiesterase [Alteromonas lipolytica]GGF69039.1 alkaline phosphatase family protein [Alteromonas lipolytica]
MKGLSLGSLLCCLLLTSLTARAERPEQHVVLISIDGFRHDYIEKHNASALARIAREGVRAESMQPVYPANTFPNHISLLTGLLPVNHGIVNNRFYDKSRHAYYSMGEAYKDSTWITAMPFWNLVETHGYPAATYFWPESDSRIGGQLPTYHFHYSKYSDYKQRVDQIMEWLSYPEATRPLFIAGYFSLIDTEGHNFGPDAEQTYEAVQLVDKLIGQLYDRLQTLPIKVNLVIVSDHGMIAVDKTQVTFEDELDISDDFLLLNEGEQILLYAKDGVSEAAVKAQYERLKAQNLPGVRVFDEGQRKHYHMPRNQRTGDIIITIDAPARFAKNKQSRIGPGGHGYLPEHPDMGATFVAAGPAFKQGVTVPRFSNLEVYPALARVLGLEIIRPIDGKLDVLKQALAEQ